DDLGRPSTIDRRFAINDTLGFAQPVAPVLSVPQTAPRPVATFKVAHAATVIAKIETQTGVVLRTIGKTRVDPGAVQVSWDGRTDDGAAVYSGQYVARLTATNGLGTVALTTTFGAVRIPGP